MTALPCQRCGTYVSGEPKLCPHCDEPFDGRPRLGTMQRPYATAHPVLLECALAEFERETYRASLLGWIYFAVGLTVIIAATVTTRDIVHIVTACWLTAALGQRREAIDRGRKLARAVRR